MCVVLAEGDSIHGPRTDAKKVGRRGVDWH